VVAHLGKTGETHLLARTEDEWYDALARLLTEKELRRTMGAAGRAYAVAHYSFEDVGRALDGLLRGVSSRARGLRT
jgi:glycosyltransferase involved in cell wall biosynthesis